MIFVCLCRKITERIVQAHGYIADLQIYHGLFLYGKDWWIINENAKGQMIICVIPGRCYKRRPGDIIRGCHNRDKGTAEREGLRDPKFIFFTRRMNEWSFWTAEMLRRKKFLPWGWGDSQRTGVRAYPLFVLVGITPKSNVWELDVVTAKGKDCFPE